MDIKKKVRDVVRQEAKEAIKESGIQAKEIRALVREEIKAANNRTQKEIERIANEYGEIGIAVVKSGGSDAQVLLRQLEKAVEEDQPEKACKIIKKLAGYKKQSNQVYLNTAQKMHAVILKKGGRKKYADCLKELFNIHTIDEFTSDQFADVYHHHIPVMQAASLTQQYVRRRRMKQIGQVPDRWLPYDKEAGLLFADMARVKRVRTVFDIKIGDIQRRSDLVIKPMISRGSIGTYLVKGLNEILVPRDQKVLSSWDEMLTHAADLVSRGLIVDSFMEQDMIYADKEKKLPAHDLKFYTFYGEIGCVNEIARDPGLAYWWYKPDGTDIDLGIQNPENVVPIGFKPEYMEIAAELSKKIPCPHMRIDFLVGEDGLYFSEFCSATGSQVETIIEVVSPAWDRALGNMYLKAEMRIVNDLLAGKKFDEINEFNRICDEKYRKK